MRSRDKKHYTVYLDSGHLACKPNRVLTCKLLRYFKENNHRLTNDVKYADFIIYNTCGFTKKAETLCVNFFKEILGKVKNETKLISLGCLNKINPDIYRDKLWQKVIVLENEKDLDEYFMNTTPYDKLQGEYIEDKLFKELNKPLHNTNAGLYYYFEKLLPKFSPFLQKSPFLSAVLGELYQKNNFFVQIASGCAGSCAYCIIKKAKGNTVSRDVNDIIGDIKKAYTPGYTLYLVADDCGSYGVEKKSSLPELLEAINKELPGIKIKINYLNPLWLQKEEKKYLDIFKNLNITGMNLSIQSGSNKTIKHMNRKYDVEQIKMIIKKIRRISPSTLLWSHLIVGFPGENVWDYVKTLSIIGYFPLVGIFGYSDREGIKSVTMPKKKSKLTILIRSKIARFYSLVLIMIRTLLDFSSSWLTKPEEKREK